MKIPIYRSAIIVLVMLMFQTTATSLLGSEGVKASGTITDLNNQSLKGVRIIAVRVSKNILKYKRHSTIKDNWEIKYKPFLNRVDLIPTIKRETTSDSSGRWTIHFISEGVWQIIGFKNEYMTQPFIGSFKDKNLSSLNLKLNISSTKFLMDTKRLLFKKDFSKVIEQLEWFIRYFPYSKNRENALYWLGYSILKFSERTQDYQLKLKLEKTAISYLDELISVFPAGKWNDDARILRINFASKLISSGHNKYKKYILSETHSVEGIFSDIKIIALNALYEFDRPQAQQVISDGFKMTRQNSILDKMMIVLLKRDPGLAEKLLAQLEIDQHNRNNISKWKKWLLDSSKKD